MTDKYECNSRVEIILFTHTRQEEKQTNRLHHAFGITFSVSRWFTMRGNSFLFILLRTYSHLDLLCFRFSIFSRLGTFFVHSRSGCRSILLHSLQGRIVRFPRSICGVNRLWLLNLSLGRGWLQRSTGRRCWWVNRRIMGERRIGAWVNIVRHHRRLTVCMRRAVRPGLPIMGGYKCARWRWWIIDWVVPFRRGIL